MKEYEDLSAEYLLGLRDACYPYTGDDILYAYQAGFLKAREMILTHLKDSQCYEWDESEIKEIGEKQV